MKTSQEFLDFTAKLERIYSKVEASVMRRQKLLGGSYLSATKRNVELYNERTELANKLADEIFHCHRAIELDSKEVN